tara:strand:- start:68 stop:622 length:555 start_codon:yes stop_codon:yes gene_type:complete
MPPRSLNRREYGEFKQMLERALREIKIPGGVINSDHIVPGSISPALCNLDASWNFKGNVSVGHVGINVLHRKINQVETKVNQQAQSQNEKNKIVELDDRANAGDEDIYFLDARTNTNVLTLPLSSKNVGRKIYVKRIDKDTTKICRVITSGNDELDDTCGIELTAQQAVILIASSKQWHVFSSL